MSEPAAAVPKKDLVVVGLGGSAGSIPAFREFFRNVPHDSGMAYVVILHLSPEYESRLAEILQSSTAIAVHQVRESVKVEPNQVYVIPPNKSLALRGGMLHVSDISGHEERRAPVDIFFRTLADTLDSRAVCVIVSGTGADGSMGLRRVKEYNGLVLAQDPSEAEFGDMPRSSIATGLVDYVIPVADMPRKIAAYRAQLDSMPLQADDSGEEEQALIDVFTQLRLRTGHDFTNYKRATVLRRIQRRLAVREVGSLAAYAQLLRERIDEADALLRELLISVTNFFRDKHVWERLEEVVVPRLLQGKGAADHVRVWVPGCATGEEAYSMAMLLAEAAAHLPVVPDVQIFATDLDQEAIAKARNGFYTVAEMADVAPERVRRYFVKEQDGYRIGREIRELVLFAHHNLIKDPPFSHLDFISCRNLLMYLNRTAQRRAVEVLHFALGPGGYLLLGTAESVDGASQLFSVYDKESHIYQSRPVGRVVTVPPPAPLTASTDLRAVPEPRGETRASRFAPLDLHQRLLEEYAPPSLIVDGQHNIVHLTDRATRYLQFNAGEASLNVLQVVKPELRVDLRSALFQAAQKQTTVTARAIIVRSGERSETINIVVRPVWRDGDSARGYFLVIFEEARASVELTASSEHLAVEPGTRQLEDELTRVRSQMRLTIDQYEVQAEEARAANEELQAMNEELRSTAEELETSQEELQSVNEELQTVNQELKVKIDEITHTSDDIRNLMSSTEIGTIFVDRALRVKLFTPRIRDIFNLIPDDVGRPLLDISNRLAVDGLAADLDRVLDRLQTIEREVKTRDGRWHLMRLLPYRTAEDRIDGVVLTFLDVTERKRAEEALRRSSEELELRVAERTRELSEAKAMVQALVDASPLAIIAVDAEERVMAWNASAERILGIRAEDVLGQPLPETAAVAGARHALLRTLLEDGTPRVADVEIHRDGGTSPLVSISTAPLRRPDGTVYAVMGMLQDITGRKRMEQEREQLLHRIVSGQEEERQRIARELHDELGQHLTALKIGLETLQPPHEGAKQLTRIVAEIDRSVDRLTLELRPPALDDVGLYGAIGSLIEQFTASSGLHVDVHSTGEDGARLPENVETTLYRVLQEALTNVWRHAAATKVSVLLKRSPEQVQLIVEDDGRGFVPGDGDDVRRGQFGLLGMRERVALIGGSFNIESTPGYGTTLYVRVPL